MRRLTFLGEWHGTGASDLDACRPTILDEWLAAGVSWSRLRDLGQPLVIPDPNLCAWEAIVEDAGEALLEASPDYVILTSEAFDG